MILDQTKEDGNLLLFVKLNNIRVDNLVYTYSVEKIIENIQEASLRFLMPLTPEETYITIVEEAKKITNAQHGTILLKERKSFRRVYASIPALYTTSPRKKGRTYKALTSKKAFIDTPTKFIYTNSKLRRFKIKSVIFIPLSYKNMTIGVLNMLSAKVDPLTEKELSYLKLFGAMASLSIKKTQLYTEVKEALQARDLFISLASHEIKTPLTTINGYVQLLQHKMQKQEMPNPKWIRELALATERLTNLVHEFLRVDRIKAGRFYYRRRPCSLGEIAKRSMSEFKFGHPERIVTFLNKANNAKVLGDFDKLVQVMTNLLNNAAKFSPPDSEITLSLKEKSPYLIISVKDKGSGIAKKDLVKVFEGFYKGDHGREGMGLGLFLTKTIVENHKGTIQVSSKLKKGTTIEVILPKTNGNESKRK